MIIENVDWQITADCNRKCEYCFGPKCVQSISKNEVFQVVDALQRIGVKQIGITGGEPLVYTDIDEVLRYIKLKGINIYLSTNCDFYFKHLRTIKEYVSIIGLPLDGADEKTHDLHRGEGSFRNVLKTIEDVSNSGLKVRVGTVITKYNYNQLKEIEKLLKPITSQVLFWKLYEMVSYARNKEQVQRMKVTQVTEEVFRELGSIVGVEKIIYDTIELRNQSYFFIRPNGDVFVPILRVEKSEEAVIGNILNTPLREIVNRFQSFVNQNGYMSVYRYMRN